MVDAGWYPDPAQRHPHRFWDGARWTEHVAGPSGESVDPLGPEPEPGSVAADDAAKPAPGDIRCDPTELQAVLAQLGVSPMPAGDGTPFGEPLLVLAWSESRADALEWWTPDGLLVAVATLVEASEAEIEEHGVATDVATGSMVATRLAISAADGTPIATTIRTLKPAKPPTFVDDPAGGRIASVAQEKMFSRIPSHVCTAADGTRVGRFEGVDSKGSAMVLSDAAGARLATVVKHGAWGAASVVRELGRDRPFQSPGEWLGSRVADAVLPIRRERICSALVLDRPVSAQPQALLTFLAPLLLEHTMSIV